MIRFYKVYKEQRSVIPKAEAETRVILQNILNDFSLKIKRGGLKSRKKSIKNK